MMRKGNHIMVYFSYYETMNPEYEMEPVGLFSSEELAITAIKEHYQDTRDPDTSKLRFNIPDKITGTSDNNYLWYGEDDRMTGCYRVVLVNVDAPNQEFYFYY